MYRAPLREMRFVLEELLRAGSLSACPPFAEYSDELGRSVLEEAGRFAETVLDPLNQPGDAEGARWTPQGVVAAPGEGAPSADASAAEAYSGASVGLSAASFPLRSASIDACWEPSLAKITG